MASDFKKKTDVIASRVHMTHCNCGKYVGSCKYGDEDCPAIILQKPIDNRAEELFEEIIRKHKERLAYNAAYQRDLRKIKKLGLNCTVAEYRKKTSCAQIDRSC